MNMKKKRKENLDYLMAKHPDLYKSYQEFGHALHEKGGPLDDKTRWLIKIAVSAASQFDFALQTHIEKALKAGCTAEEIEHTILLTAPSAGFPRMMAALMIFRETVDA